MKNDKVALYSRGIARVRAFCTLNNIREPEIGSHLPERGWYFGVCAYYRPDTGIVIHLPSCASPATERQVRNWNWPGSVTDRTPYGVVAHELGHHVDWETGSIKGRYFSDYGIGVEKAVKELPISSYCPNPAEWFAEMFRVFVTNPELLRQLRPRTYRELTRKFTPIPSRNWTSELRTNIPSRILANLRRKVEAAGIVETVGERVARGTR